MAIDPLDLLSEMQREEAQHALENPEAKERLVVATLVELRDKARFCESDCRPKFEHRVSRLERRMWKGLTLWALLAGIGAAVAVAWGVYK